MWFASMPVILVIIDNNSHNLIHCQIIVNAPARCGLTNPQPRRKSGLDMAIQAEP